jgi:hypothetical protein
MGDIDNYPYVSRPAPASATPVELYSGWSARQWGWVFAFLGGLALAGISFLIGKELEDSMSSGGMSFFSWDPFGIEDMKEFTIRWIVTAGEICGFVIAAMAVIGGIATFALTCLVPGKQRRTSS